MVTILCRKGYIFCLKVDQVVPDSAAGRSLPLPHYGLGATLTRTQKESVRINES